MQIHFLTIQDQISLDNGKFAICMAVLYFYLKRKYTKDLK